MMGRPTAQFCKRGHDTYVAGRFSNGWCRACSEEVSTREARTTRGKGNWGDKPTRYPVRWERARVKRWYEITAADPMPQDTPKGAVGRFKEFDKRYERLEAAVPTPENL